VKKKYQRPGLIPGVAVVFGEKEQIIQALAASGSKLKFFGHLIAWDFSRARWLG
jgi:hypothetical protein